MSSSFTMRDKINDYRLLIKFSLTFMVAFSAVISYLLAPNVVVFDWGMIGLLFLGGMLVTGSANTINQIVERDTDAMMKRTANRPIAAGRMTVNEGWIAAVVMIIAGEFILGYYFNVLSAAVALVSWFIYAFMYTPMKKVSSASVLVGGIPGALPCLIGWAAGQDELSVGGWVLFAIQFFWQFPHFWAIAWIAHGDYTKAVLNGEVTLAIKVLPAQGSTGRKFSRNHSIRQE